MKTTAVIIHWGPAAPTLRLVAELAAIRAVTEIVIIANDLQPRPADLLYQAIWLVPPRNLGFGGGFRHACDSHPAADCYLLLNNDVRISATTVDECLELLGLDDVGIVGPTLVNASGIHPGNDGLSLVNGTRKRRRFPTGDADDVRWVTGAAMFIKAECHLRAPMPMRYFLVYEDVDICYRARAAGWRVVASPSIAWHTGGTTIPSLGYTYYTTRNRIWFTRGYHGRRRAALVIAWMALAMLPRILFSGLLRGEGDARAWFALRGVVDGMRRLPDEDLVGYDEPRAAQWGSWTKDTRRRA